MVLIILLILALFGGIGTWGTPYGYGGVGISTVLAIVLIILLLRGRL
jgi:hypothetical protein